MLLIHCPFCGPRDELEFHSGGQSHISRPGPAAEVDDATWGGYLFDRENPRGPHAERWVHLYGCRQWFNMIRDTTTHEILAAYAMDDAKPELGR